MLLGIILFYIKSVFVIPQSPGIDAGGWRDLPPTGSFNPLSSCPHSLGQESKWKSEQEPHTLADPFTL